MTFFRKKLSSFTHHSDWHRAYNYVAKRYMEDVTRDVYFEDVKLQMDAKLWGEEYNRHNPPKKVRMLDLQCLMVHWKCSQQLYNVQCLEIRVTMQSVDCGNDDVYSDTGF